MTGLMPWGGGGGKAGWTEQEDPEQNNAVHPSSLRQWSVATATKSSEVGVIVRVNSVEKVDTADKAIGVHIQRMAYRLFSNEQELELLRAVHAQLNGEHSGVCPWNIVAPYCPKLKFGRVVGETKIMAQIAWVDASDDWDQLTIVFQEDMVIHLRDPAPARSFPFDWHCYILDIMLEPTEECPNGTLRGTVDDSAGFEFRRWSKKKGMSMQHRREIVRQGDPFHDHWSYIDKNNRSKLIKHSALRIEKSHIPDWMVYIHKNLDTDANKDPWPYWLTTEENGETGWSSNVQLRFWMQRQPNLYIYNALLPATVMELLALLTFFIDQHDIGARQRSITTLMLVVYAIKFSACQANPNVGYTTMFDAKFLTSMFFLAVVMALQHLFLMFKNDFMTDDECETAALLISVVSVTLSNLFFWVTALYEYMTAPEPSLARPVLKRILHQGGAHGPHYHG